MTQTIDRMTCPTWCARQDCVGDEPEIVIHESPVMIARATVGDDPIDLAVSAEQWRHLHPDEVNQDGAAVRVKVPELNGPFRWRSFDLTAAQARRLAALLLEHAALI